MTTFASVAKKTTKSANGGGVLASVVAAAAFVAVTVESLKHKPEPPRMSLALVDAEAEANAAKTAAPLKAPPALLRKLDGWQRRHPVVGFPFGVAKKFGDDRAGYLAALVSYFAFFSLFPLLMALTSILGMVLKGHEDWQEKVTGNAFQQIPVIGPTLTAGKITGSVVAVVVGVAVALWSGLKVIDAAQNALNDVWDVPLLGRPKFLKRRLKSVLLLGVIGLSLIASLASGSIAGLLPDLPGGGRFGVYAVTLLFNVGVFLLAFKLLSEIDHSWGELVPGSVFAAVGFFVLQVPGAIYIKETIEKAKDTYNTFATVIGLLTFFFLASQIVIIGAEINVVRKRKLWPRSLLALYGELTPADRQVYSDSAAATRRLPGQRVQVGFGYPPQPR